MGNQTYFMGSTFCPGNGFTLPQMNLHLSSTNAAVKFQEVYTRWEKDTRNKVKESTWANYQMKAQRFILPKFGDCPIDKITINDIRAFAQDLMAQDLSNKYIRDILSVLKSVLLFAEQQYHVQNPMTIFMMPPRVRSDLSLLSTKDQHTLEQYIAAHHNLETLGIAIAKSTGLRVGELCALQWKDIDLEKRILTVKKTMLRIQSPDEKRKTKLIITTPKSASSFRKIPIPASLLPFLLEFADEQDVYVTAGREKPVEPRTVQKRFTRILKAAGLPIVNFHALRHMFATNCIKLGFDMKTLSELLGHSNVEVTMKIYVHSSMEQKAEYMDRLTMAI